VQVNAIQALAATTAAVNAAALGRTDIASTLSGLSGAINTAISSCTPAAQQLVVDYVNNLIQEMNAPFLANFVATFQADATAISSRPPRSRLIWDSTPTARSRSRARLRFFRLFCKTTPAVPIHIR
jgi:hypothetical protein